MPRPYSRIDLLLIGVLLAVAVAVRLPYLQLIPLVTDEAFEVLAALSVSRGNWILFGPVNPTAGPLIAYLLALCFWIFGSGVYLARIAIMALGVLTVALTYVLGRSMGGRRAGLIAGALLAFSPIHTIVNSHVAWSNSASPFFTTLVFVVLHAALLRRDGRLLVLGGFLYGLALQTHVSLLVVGPGLLVWFLARRDLLAWLRQPWPYLAAGAALLTYGNMIAYNLVSAGGGLADFQQHTYAWVSQPTWGSYWTNLKTMVKTVALTLGGQVPGIHDPVGDLVTGLLLIWLVAALVWATRRGETMPLFILLSTTLIMPYFNKRYEGLLSQRYTAFLMPLCFATMGLAAAQALDLWRTRRWPLARAVTVGGMALVLLLAFYPLRATFTHYAVETGAGQDNSLTLALTNHLEQTLPPDTPLYLSSNFKRGVYADGGYRYLRAMYYFLTLEGVDHLVLDMPDIVARLEAEGTQETWLLLTRGDYETLSALPDLTLEPIEGGPPIINDGLLARTVPVGQGP